MTAKSMNINCVGSFEYLTIPKPRLQFIKNQKNVLHGKNNAVLTCYIILPQKTTVRQISLPIFSSFASGAQALRDQIG